MTKINFKLIALLLICICFVSPELIAQCPMCKMAAESNLENGGSAGAGLNKGILFMLTTPYIIVACLGFVWYKNRKKEEDTMIDDVNDLLQQDYSA